ncbi:MAG: hypothetical protein LQ342_003191 [Letrouitia transgressa]|nr:MAG: hypothetical protein LQ342_003191 [Letrouitia transgressa]
MASRLDPRSFISIQPESTSAPSPQPAHSHLRGTSTAFESPEPPTHHQTSHARHPTSHSHSSSEDDLENTFRHSLESDPYQLSSKIKSPKEINSIRASTSRKRDGCGPISTNKAASKGKKLQHFYETQNDNIERWLRPVDEHIRLAKEFNGDNQLKYKIAVRGSLAANILLASLQLFAAAYSGSLSLFTTMADAIFDPLSNITLMLCNRAVGRVDARKFPSGKARIETAGNIVFCFLMTAVSLILIVLSCMELAEGNPAPRDCVPSPADSCGSRKTKDFHAASIAVVGFAFFLKFLLFCYCWALKGVYSQIHILWEDHRNDMFINGFGALTSVGGSYLRWWIDPMGAILLSVIISALWLRTAWQEFELLVGVTADTRMLQWITYIYPPRGKLGLAMTHSPQILALDTVRAYHSGPRIIVEVDVVMDAHATLRTTHDVAEELQMKLESLPDVERAYVHIDFETSHKPEHGVKKVL